MLEISQGNAICGKNIVNCTATLSISFPCEKNTFSSRLKMLRFMESQTTFFASVDEWYNLFACVDFNMKHFERNN